MLETTEEARKYLEEWIEKKGVEKPAFRVVLQGFG